MFPAFICSDNIGILINSLLEVKVFSLFSSFAFSSWNSSGGMSDKSLTSYLSVDSSSSVDSPSAFDNIL